MHSEARLSIVGQTAYTLRLCAHRCGLTDFAASALSGLIKGYNANREVRVWEANLRTYPPLPMSAKASHMAGLNACPSPRAHSPHSRNVASDTQLASPSPQLRRRMQWTVNHDAYTQVLDDGANAGGLHFLDLSCNALTDTAISEVRRRKGPWHATAALLPFRGATHCRCPWCPQLLDAIIADFKMVGLSLRRNAISPAGVKRMREVLNPDDADLTKCHRSLVFVDMRWARPARFVGSAVAPSGCAPLHDEALRPGAGSKGTARASTTRPRSCWSTPFSRPRCHARRASRRPWPRMTCRVSACPPSHGASARSS